MGQLSKNIEYRNGCKSGPLQKCAFVQQVIYSTIIYAWHQLESHSKLALRATRFRRISVRSTVSTNSSHQRNNITHLTAIFRLKKDHTKVKQCATGVPQLFQHMEIPVAERKLLHPLQMIDSLPLCSQLQLLQFKVLDILIVGNILEGNLSEAVVDTVTGLALDIRSTERANKARIWPFSAINAHLFD
ncbi:MAG: hypothetical protein EZS28_001400 [Streblomastix strix]|uniref:Uncharacterized protein n=1 Tax=Streblomastix strix TaxID=222440 RepID=A0A5J4X767_9EUKA|nr:MAG: hypothetical protein EZS28_001400 [Streblomastix strix]